MPKGGAISYCSIEGCERRVDGLGYCKIHYDHLRRNGDPTKYVYRPTAEERFLSFFEKKRDDECWPWIKTIDNHGYGQFSIKHKNYRAHRIAYEMFVGKIPEGLVIDHDCHNRDKSCKDVNLCQHRRCVNPNHLIPRTLGDNSRHGNSPTMIAHNNGTCVNGHPNSSMYYRKSNGKAVQCLDCAKEKYRQKKGGVVQAYDSSNRRKTA